MSKNINLVNSTHSVVPIQTVSEPSASTSVASTLPPPTMGGNIAEQIAELMLKTDDQRRDAARQSRDAATKELVSAQDDEIHQLTAEADEKQDAADTAAVGEIASGGLSLASAAANFSAQGATSAEGRYLADNKNALNLGKSGGDIATGITGLVSAQENHEAAMSEIDVKRDAMVETQAKSSIDDARDDRKDAVDHMNRILDWFKDMESATAQASQAAVSRV